MGSVILLLSLVGTVIGSPQVRRFSILWTRRNNCFCVVGHHTLFTSTTIRTGYSSVRMVVSWMLYVRFASVSCQALTLTRSSSDSRGARTLNAASYTSSDSMTVQSCLAFCAGKGFRLAGVEWNSECCTFSSTSISFVAYCRAVCDQAVQSPGAPTALSECNYPCSGDASQTCGAGNRINLYAHGESPAPAVPQSISMHWEYEGCYTYVESWSPSD